MLLMLNCVVSVSALVCVYLCFVQLQAIQGLPGQISGAHIGIRMVGELDLKAFSNVCRQKFPKDDAEAESIKLCSKWQNEISNTNWHPFIVAMVNGKESVRIFVRLLPYT